MGTPRKHPYPWQMVQTGKLLLILYEENVHSYRQVFMDGRGHDHKVTGTWWGDSIGHWEGVDLVGHPRTHQAHITERFTRPELGRVVIELTIDDPGAYSARVGKR